MILSGTYIVLMIVLLIGVSTAKYTNSVVAYASKGASSYNIVILDEAEEYVAEHEIDGTAGVNPWSDAFLAGKPIGKTVLGSDMNPGMTEENGEATQYTFYVANGDDPENISEIASDFNIRLRTTRNLPLRYVLAAETTMYSASDPVLVDDETSGLTWYEWVFRETYHDTATQEDKVRQPSFHLSAEEYDCEIFTLFIEWPIVDTAGSTDAAFTEGVTRTNSTDYMKEVELLEVRVVAAASNNATEEPAAEYVTLTDSYGEGYVLLGQGGSAGEYLTEYPVSFDALEPESAAPDADRSYTFTVENGAAVGAEQLHTYSTYNVRLMVPFTSDTADYVYTLSTYDENDHLVTLDSELLEYRLYSKKDQPITLTTMSPSAESYEGFKTLEDVGDLSEIDETMALYAVYRFKDQGMTDEACYTFTNKGRDDRGTYVVMNSKEFRIGLSGIGAAGIPEDVAEQLSVRIQVTDNLGD